VGAWSGSNGRNLAMCGNRKIYLEANFSDCRCKMSGKCLRERKVQDLISKVLVESEMRIGEVGWGEESKSWHVTTASRGVKIWIRARVECIT